MIRFSPRLVTFVALAASAVAVPSPAEARGKKEEVAAPAAPPAPKADRFHDETGARRPFLERLKRVERKTFVVREGGNVGVEVVPRTSLILHLPVDCANLWNEWYAAPEACTPKHVEGQWWAPYASFTDAGIDVTLPAQVVAEKWNLKSAGKYEDIRATMEGVVTYTDTLDKARAWAANPGDWVEERVQGKDGVTLVGAVAKEGLSVRPPRGGLVCLSGGTDAHWEAMAPLWADWRQRMQAEEAREFAEVRPRRVDIHPAVPWRMRMSAPWSRGGSRASAEDGGRVPPASEVLSAEKMSLAGLHGVSAARGSTAARVRWWDPQKRNRWDGTRGVTRRVRIDHVPAVPFGFAHQSDLSQTLGIASRHRSDARTPVEATVLGAQPDELVSAFRDRSFSGDAWRKLTAGDFSEAWRARGARVDLDTCTSENVACLEAYVVFRHQMAQWVSGMYEEDGLSVPALPDASGKAPDMVCESAPHEGYATRLALSPDTPAGIRFRPVKVWVPDYPANWKSTQPMPTRGARGRWDYMVPGASLDELFN